MPYALSVVPMFTKGLERVEASFTSTAKLASDQGVFRGMCKSSIELCASIGPFAANCSNFKTFHCY